MRVCKLKAISGSATLSNNSVVDGLVGVGAPGHVAEAGVCRFLLQTFPRWWTSWQCPADVRRCGDADPEEEELFLGVQEKQEEQFFRMTRAGAKHGDLSNPVNDGSASVLFVIDYVKRNDDEVRQLQGGI